MLPDRPVFLHLLVDLLHERVGDRGGELLVVELAHDEVEPHLRGLRVDRRGRGDVDRVDDATEPHFGESGAVVVHVDATFGDAARRHVRLLRQHRRTRAVGVVLLHLGDSVGAVHELEVRGVGAVLRHLLRDRADHVRRRVEVAPRGVTDLLDDGDLPLRLFAVRVVPREHEAVALDDGIRTHPRLAIRALAVRDVRARAGAVELPTVERACRRSPSTVPPYARCAPRCGQNASCRWNAPLMSRHNTNSLSQYSTAVTSPGARSLGNATWYQPNGIGNGNRRDAMPGILEHVPILRSAIRCDGRATGA